MGLQEVQRSVCEDDEADVSSAELAIWRFGPEDGAVDCDRGEGAVLEDVGVSEMVGWCTAIQEGKREACLVEASRRKVSGRSSI